MTPLPNFDVTIFDNCTAYDNPCELFKEYCNDMLYVIKGDNENNMAAYDENDMLVTTCSDYMNGLIETDMEDFIDLLNYMEDKSPYITKCVVTGTLGLWNGTHTIVPTLIDNLGTAIRQCLTDANYFTVTVKDNKIHVTAHHHDGTNNFDIVLLNSEDYDHVNELESDEDIDDFIEKNKMNLYWEYFSN